MEPAQIDWKSLQSVFVLDQVYENINAPQWIDFLAPNDPRFIDDEAWFCRPDCKHPKTAEAFLKSTPTSKLLRSVSVSKLIGDWSWRESNLKRRGLAQSSTADEENENQNPNFCTPNHQIKSFKATIKSSAEKVRVTEEESEYSEILLHSDEKPRLKSTQSARDLFGGKEIFGKITEFCNELKKMASSRAKDREIEETERTNSKNNHRPPLEVKVKEGSRDVLGCHLEKMNEREKERKPLLEVSRERYEAGEKSNVKGKQKKNKKGADETENIPISLDLKNIKRKEDEKLLQIRTNPPTPQGFSATRDPTKITPSKGSKSRLMEREILQELEQSKTLKEELAEKRHSKNASLVAGKEARTLDVFWFLKPCTL